DVRPKRPAPADAPPPERDPMADADGSLMELGHRGELLLPRVPTSPPSVIAAGEPGGGRLLARQARDYLDGDRSLFNPVSPLYAAVAQVANTFNNTKVFGFTYAVTQWPPSFIRELLLRNSLDQPLFDAPTLNTAWQMLVAVGAAHGTDWGMRLATRAVRADSLEPVLARLRGLLPPESPVIRVLEQLKDRRLDSTIPWTIVGVNVGAIGADYLKQVLQAETLNVPALEPIPMAGSPRPARAPPAVVGVSFPFRFTGETVTIPNPLKVLPTPAGFGPDGSPRFASCAAWWAGPLRGAR